MVEVREPVIHTITVGVISGESGIICPPHLVTSTRTAGKVPSVHKGTSTRMIPVMMTAYIPHRIGPSSREAVEAPFRASNCTERQIRSSTPHLGNICDGLTMAGGSGTISVGQALEGPNLGGIYICTNSRAAVG